MPNVLSVVGRRESAGPPQLQTSGTDRQSLRDWWWWVLEGPMKNKEDESAGDNSRMILARGVDQGSDLAPTLSYLPCPTTDL